MRMDKMANTVARKVLAEKGDKEEYQKYFQKKLDKWNVKSPAEIPKDKKDEFFDEVDKGWKGDKETD